MPDTGVVTDLGERATRARWVQDFTATIAAIRAEWLVTVEDGSLWILPAYHDEPVVVLHRRLASVGFARGWLR
jgi:hypothetical protein